MDEKIPSSMANGSPSAKEAPLPKAGYQIIQPPNTLQAKLTQPEGPHGHFIGMAAIRRAEKAVKELATNFHDWMGEEVAKLSAARDQVAETNFSPEALDALFTAAHDIKGHAETLGYPAAAPICLQLCQLLERAPVPERIPLELLDHHVNTVRAIWRERVTKSDHPKARAIAAKLRDVTSHFLVSELRRAKMDTE